jgi:hypothetical protein
MLVAIIDNWQEITQLLDVFTKEACFERKNGF